MIEAAEKNDTSRHYFSFSKTGLKHLQCHSGNIRNYDAAFIHFYMRKKKKKKKKGSR